AQQIENHRRALQHICRELRLVFVDEPTSAIDLVIDVLEPELRRLMRNLEQRLFRMDELLFRLLQLEQLRNPNVPLVISVAAAFEDRTGMCAHFAGLRTED